MKELIQKVKDSEFDYEFYPTTSEIIKIINSDIQKQYSKFEISILDIGAGNGNFFKVLESLNQKKSDCKFIKYAIEKSPILIENMNPDIFIVGTEFHEQTLIDKKTDIIFCNPPYSEYESWTEKIIAEGNCDMIYMVIPERWKSNKKIKEIISKRGFSYKVIGNTDFIDSEYRQARAKVDIIRFKCKVDRIGDRSYNCTIKDPFDLWFNNFFKIKAQPKEDDYLSKRQKEEEKKENIKKHMVKGQNLIERLEDLYRKDFENLLNNYRKIEELDYEIFKELGIDLNNLKEGLKLKISGLKNLYWHELFDNMETITSRLTKKSREKLLKKLTEHTTIDFTSGNAYAIVLWAIKNANIYLDKQLQEVYLWMTRTENIQNYKSNQRMIKDDWRYCQDHTHYTLDYRLVLHGYNNFNSGSWGNYNYPNGLNSQTHDSINDMITIGKNLGFDVKENSFNFEWQSGKSVDFTCQKGLFMSVRAYKNGNIHIKTNQEFMKKLNIEAGRLNGWVKSPEEASKETDIPLSEIKELFGSNLQLAISQYKMLA